jgi:hypothetical protein
MSFSAFEDLAIAVPGRDRMKSVSPVATVPAMWTYGDAMFLEKYGDEIAKGEPRARKSFLAVKNSQTSECPIIIPT